MLHLQWPFMGSRKLRDPRTNSGRWHFYQFQGCSRLAVELHGAVLKTCRKGPGLPRNVIKFLESAAAVQVHLVEVPFHVLGGELRVIKIM